MYETSGLSVLPFEQWSADDRPFPVVSLSVSQSHTTRERKKETNGFCCLVKALSSTVHRSQQKSILHVTYIIVWYITQHNTNDSTKSKRRIVCYHIYKTQENGMHWSPIKETTNNYTTLFVSKKPLCTPSYQIHYTHLWTLFVHHGLAVLLPSALVEKKRKNIMEENERTFFAFVYLSLL